MRVRKICIFCKKDCGLTKSDDYHLINGIYMDTTTVCDKCAEKMLPAAQVGAGGKFR